MKAAGKTNAVRLLDSLSMAYELRAYEVGPDPLAQTALDVAHKVGMPAGQVFKTLLLAGEGQHFFAVIPGDCELDLKKAALTAQVKKLEMASLKEVEPLTGYVRGGVTVLAAKKPFPAFVDEAAELYDCISVSAGQRGLQVVLAPADYLRAAQATVADLTRTATR